MKNSIDLPSPCHPSHVPRHPVFNLFPCTLVRLFFPDTLHPSPVIVFTAGIIFSIEVVFYIKTFKMFSACEAVWDGSARFAALNGGNGVG